jgi:copper(I)-binding protein
MLMGSKQTLKEGDTFPMTLEFEKAGRLQVTVTVLEDARGTARGG